MKSLLLFLLAFSILGAKGQNLTDSSFQVELLTIINDAKVGFPKATGSAQKEENWQGQNFSSRWGFYGKNEDAYLVWQKAQVYKYAKADPVPERFYFSQAFKQGTPAATFVCVSGERILDEIAKMAGLVKREVKQKKENRKKYREFEWLGSGNKMVFSLLLNVQDSSAVFEIDSPYRPGGKVVPRLLGCMVFTNGSSSFMYVMPVYTTGDGSPDKESLAARTFRASGLTSDFRYSWYPGSSSANIEKQFGKSYGIRMLNDYIVQ